LLAETWPACFFVYERRRRPLALGIHHHILAVLDGALTPQELRRALRYHVGNTWYLRAIVAGATGSTAAQPALSASKRWLLER
jgi:sRNA-binding protein